MTGDSTFLKGSVQSGRIIFAYTNNYIIIFFILLFFITFYFTPVAVINSLFELYYNCDVILM